MDEAAAGSDSPSLTLTPQLLEVAYRSGIFPMAMNDGSIAWFSPDPRAIIPIGALKVTRSLRRSATKYEVKLDENFREIMERCADRPEGTWISDEFINVYARMFELGKARCAGAFFEGRLVGGVYGVLVERAFMAESMFHLMTDAGKVALWKLMEALDRQGVVLFDVQFMTPHLKKLGAVEISRAEYLSRLTAATSNCT